MSVSPLHLLQNQDEKTRMISTNSAKRTANEARLVEYR